MQCMLDAENVPRHARVHAQIRASLCTRPDSGTTPTGCAPASMGQCCAPTSCSPWQKPCWLPARPRCCCGRTGLRQTRCLIRQLRYSRRHCPICTAWCDHISHLTLLWVLWWSAYSGEARVTSNMTVQVSSPPEENSAAMPGAAAASGDMADRMSAASAARSLTAGFPKPDLGALPPGHPSKIGVDGASLRATEEQPRPEQRLPQAADEHGQAGTCESADPAMEAADIQAWYDG